MNIKKFKKDFIWYSIGAAIPMIIGFIRTPIFTRYFSPYDYGNYNLINTTYNYINLFSFTWILSCVWRYYLHEKNEKELNKFYTNVIALLLTGIIMSGIATFIWIILAGDILSKKLIIANYINLTLTSITSAYLTTLRLDGSSLKYNLIAVAISFLSFGTLLILTFLFKNSIDALLNSSNIINIILCGYIVFLFTNKIKVKIDRYEISKKMISQFIKYGSATIVFNVSQLLLDSGDRYVIKIFNNTDKVGIYSQIYGVAQISIVAISTIFNNIINPYLFKLLEEDKDNAREFYNYIILYTICILPFTVYFSIYSKQIAALLLGEKFRIGYKMMPYIMVSSFISNLADMHATHLKFKNKLKNICINVISASVVNIVLNFTLIPFLGYEFAAITTLISYTILFAMNIHSDTKDIHVVLNIFKGKLLSNVFILLAIQVLFHYILINEFDYCSTVIYSIIEGFIFLSIYIIFVYHKTKKKLSIASTV